jgi:hypothetical protein
MRARGTLTENVGENIEDYVERAVWSLEWSSFEKRFCAYLRDQNVSVEMDYRTIKTLFDITVEFLKERPAASDIKKARLDQDWREQRKMATALEKLLLNLEQLAEVNSRLNDKPHTALLARSVLRKIKEFRRELRDVKDIQRARELRLSIFMRIAKNERSFVGELDKYLQYRIPWLSVEKRSLVIAATMIGSALKSNAEAKDYAANVPMARSRANSEMVEEGGPTVKWLDQPPLRRPRQRSPFRTTDKRRNKRS